SRAIGTSRSTIGTIADRPLATVTGTGMRNATWVMPSWASAVSTDRERMTTSAGALAGAGAGDGAIAAPLESAPIAPRALNSAAPLGSALVRTPLSGRGRTRPATSTGTSGLVT